MAALSKLLRWLLVGIKSLCLILLLGWGALAIYYSNLPWGWARLALAVVFFTFGVWARWISRTLRAVGGVVEFWMLGGPGGVFGGYLIGGGSGWGYAPGAAIRAKKSNQIN